MKFKFNKNLEYQVEAVKSVVDLFKYGQNYLVTRDQFGLHSQIVSNDLYINEERVCQNLKSIQERNNLVQSQKLESKDLKSSQKTYDFTVEMETGTGKTYVYLRTILELNKKYGLKKFIILVPSVAIREGVLKTIEQTRAHFKDIYNTHLGAFVYDSSKLSEVRDFTQSSDIRVMIMTIQSFVGDTKVMRQVDRDDTYGESSYLEMVSKVRPVVVMDEPQNMASDLSETAINDLCPLFKLRYSATHREIINQVYKLTPIDAYKMNLVKKIQVYGVKALKSISFYLKLSEVGVLNKKLFAKVNLEKRNISGGYSLTTDTVYAGADLFVKTGRNEKYKDLYVTDINVKEGFIELSNGEKFFIENNSSNVDIFRVQVRETIKAHFSKQKQLGPKAKVLSLFFIDRVDNYINNGFLAKVFDEEFEKEKKSSDFFRIRSSEEVRKGYFANKTVKGVVEFKDTKGNTEMDKQAYDLIMKNKERLLSFEEPVSFIFSHSALKEGWDNPNIFQICTLRQTNSEIKKRQEIGRGLRLPLNVDGDRIDSPETNVLTVIANESYEEYVASLQTEFEESGYSLEGYKPVNARERREVKTTSYLQNVDFNKLWEKIRTKTYFNIELDVDTLIKESIKKINNLDISGLSISVDKVEVFFGENNQVKTSYVSSSVTPLSKKEVSIKNFINEIATETGLTKKTIFNILNKIENLDLIFENPEEFTRAVVTILNTTKEDLLVNDSVKYFPMKDSWGVDLFTGFDSYLSKLFKTKKSPYEYVEFDSEGEREFAEHLENSTSVKVYTKLPRGFFLDTPIGKYRPDWAIVWSTGEGDKLYLVRETKFGQKGVLGREVLNNLRPEEKKKILYGEKHFKAVGVDFSVSTSRDLLDLLN
jgi:type III restriction enzyme